MRNFIKFLWPIYFVIGCSGQNQVLPKTRYTYTVEQLKADKGEPQKVEDNILNSDYKMYRYQDAVYQVSDNLVIAKFRDPEEKEKNIQYWRHYLKDSYYKIEDDKKSQGHHGQMKILTCPQKGITIYFDEQGNVLRIGEGLGGKNAK